MRTVVVTGGGTGIGRAVAEAFVGIGEQVVIIGRRADVLSATAEGLHRNAEQSVFWRNCDISDPDHALLTGTSTVERDRAWFSSWDRVLRRSDD